MAPDPASLFRDVNGGLPWEAKGLTPAPTTGGRLPWIQLCRVVEYIEEHLDHDLSLSELCGLAHMSQFHFARLFKHSLGMSPHRFVMRRRIDRALQLLSADGMSIAQIGRAVGFRAPSHFTTVFRRMTGLTPTTYRAQLVRPLPPLATDQVATDRDSA